MFFGIMIGINIGAFFTLLILARFRWQRFIELSEEFVNIFERSEE